MERSQLFRAESMERFRSHPWQPPILSRSLSWPLLTMCAVIAGGLLIAFATHFKFTRKELAFGHLTPADGWTKVTASRFAAVGKRLAEPGDIVNAGDALLELRSQEGVGPALTVHDELLGEIEGRRDALKVRRGLLREEQDAKAELLRRAIATNRQAIRALEGELALSESRRDIAFTRFGRSQQLAERQALSQNDLASLEEELQLRSLAVSEKRRDLQAARLSVETDEQRLVRSELDLELRLAEIEGQLHALAAERARVRDEGSSLILAPRSGRVAAMWVRPGDSLTPGQHLLDLVPADSPLRAQLFVSSQAMGFVEPGQSVRVYLDTFPYEHFGAQQGRVSSVSYTSLAPHKVSEFGIASSVPLFRVEIDFPEGFDLPRERLSSLRPGLTVSADMIRDRETLLHWLLEPLHSASARF